MDYELKEIITGKTIHFDLSTTESQIINVFKMDCIENGLPSDLILDLAAILYWFLFHRYYLPSDGITVDGLINDVVNNVYHELSLYNNRLGSMDRTLGLIVRYLKGLDHICNVHGKNFITLAHYDGLCILSEVNIENIDAEPIEDFVYTKPH